MSKGESGRIVIEVDPDLKRKLYSALAANSSTLKEWFVSAAAHYIADHEQPNLPQLDRSKRERAPKQ